MGPITTLIGSFATDVIVRKALNHILSLGWRSIYWLPFKILNPKGKARVSCSAFLRICDENKKYLLIKNVNRPEFFGPLGGCYRYFPNNAKTILERCFYQPDRRITTEDTQHDIRGFVRRNRVHEIFEWFATSHNEHESAHACLIREVKEEIFTECSISSPDDFNSSELEFVFVRAFLEKSTVTGTEITQLKLFEIYDLSLSSKSAKALYDAIAQSKSQKLIWATSGEIKSGRHMKRCTALGHASVLFVDDRLTRQDLPSYGTDNLP